MDKGLIDWHEPLREKTAPHNAWEVVVMMEDGFPWCRPIGSDVAYRFDPAGVCFIKGGVCLENIPQETEPGRYWCGYEGSPTPHLMRYVESPVGWCDEVGDMMANNPDSIIERIYDPNEYRPADKFPPPMDGTPFEVEGVHEHHFIELVGDEYRVMRKSSPGTNALWRLKDKRWRPARRERP